MNAWTFGLLIASIEGYAHGLDARHIVPGAVAALVLGYFFVRRQLHRPYPLLPVDLFRIPIFSMSIATSVCSFTAQMLAMVSLPFFLQSACGRSEVDTGLLLTAWPVAIIFVAPLAGLLVERVHAGVLGGIGLFVFSVGLFSLAFLPEEISDGGILWRMALCGAGFGLFQSPNNSLIISSAPPGRSGGASGMLATARLVGQTTGAALVALLFHLFADNGATVCLTIAGSVAAAGAVVSSIRISQPLPEALSRKGSGAIDLVYAGPHADPCFRTPALGRVWSKTLFPFHISDPVVAGRARFAAPARRDMPCGRSRRIDCLEDKKYPGLRRPGYFIEKVLAPIPR